MIEGISAEKAAGDVVKLLGSKSRHYVDVTVGEDAPASFEDMLLDSLQDVNDKQLDFSNLSEQALINPDSVDAHDITIAMAESSMSLNIAKNVIDRVLRGYREITSLR